MSEQTGVPEASINTFFSGQVTVTKGSRTEYHKWNKQEVLGAGGSCCLCWFRKKKVQGYLQSLVIYSLLTIVPPCQCSGERPCETCTIYWEKRVNQSTSFMWTCDNRSKLSDLRIFTDLTPLLGMAMYVNLLIATSHCMHTQISSQI